MLAGPRIHLVEHFDQAVWTRQLDLTLSEKFSVRGAWPRVNVDAMPRQTA
jgi:hypothetical protein